MNPIFVAALEVQEFCRALDWTHVEGIAIRRHGQLHEELIWRELMPLLELKEDEQTAPRLRILLKHGSASGSPA